MGYRLTGAGGGSGATSLSQLTDVDLSNKVDGNVLTFDENSNKYELKPLPPSSSSGGADTLTYTIDLQTWGIKNDGTDPVNTALGLYNAVWWAHDNGYNHVIIPNGLYSVKLHFAKKNRIDYTDGYLLCVIHMPSNMHLELSDNTHLELVSNSAPAYEIIHFHDDVRNSRVSGGHIKGDRNTHQYYIMVGFERGGVNSDGSLNSNANAIRCILNRTDYEVLSLFRVWGSIPELSNVTGYSFYQYKDTVDAAHLVGFKTDGLFAPSAPTGRGWFLGNDITACNKLVITMDITNNPMTDQQIAALQVKIDNGYYTNESGHCVAILGSYNVEVDHMELYDGTGDGVLTGTGDYYNASGSYPDLDATEALMGRYIYIHHNEIHNCRRNGVSLCGPNDQFLYENHIHHIGKADDGITPDFTAPGYGIDIESLIGESNVPAKSLYYGTDGIEANFRIYVARNHVHDNERGHFVNPDGTYVTVEDNIFEGYNIGGVLSYPKYMHCLFNNNKFIGCELLVQGDNIVNGAKIEGGNINFRDCEGARVSDVKIRNGMAYGSTYIGYFGTPSIDLSTSTFTFTSPHGMGNTAKVCFEAWGGKIPSGLDSKKVYYVTNASTYSFQVSESAGGSTVTIYDSGESGFNISRFNYGRLYIDGMTIERDFNTSSSDYGINLFSTGGILKNITVKNYKVFIGSNQSNYAGRPIEINNLTVVEGDSEFNNCDILNSSFFALDQRNMILATNATYNKNTGVKMSNCRIKNMNVYMGKVEVRKSDISNSIIRKENNTYRSTVLASNVKDTTINSAGAMSQNAIFIGGSVVENMTQTLTLGAAAGSIVVYGNTDISSQAPSSTPITIVATPSPGIFNSNQNVTLTATGANKIRYTTNGVDVTTGSSLYSTAISVTSPTIIKAIAYDASDNILATHQWFYDVDTIAPSNVTNLAASNTLNDRTTLNWTGSISTDAVRYDVYKDNTFIASVNVPTTTYTMTGLVASTTYTIKVVTVDDANNQSSGTSINVTTSGDTSAPVDVTGLQADLTSDTVVGLTWLASVSTDIDHYDVYKNGTLMGSSVTNNYSASGLTPNTSYTFMVKSIDVNGNASGGASITLTTASLPVGTNSGYVTDGLIMYQENIASGTTPAHKDSYFVGDGSFTFAVTAILSQSARIAYRKNLSDISQSNIQIDVAGTEAGQDSYIQMVLTGKDRNTGTYSNITVNSNISSPPRPQLINVQRHYTFVKNTSDHTIKVYVNGSLIKSTAWGANLITNGAGSPLALQFGNSVSPLTTFKVVAYYNRALSDAEITQNYNALADTTPPSNVTGLTANSLSTGTVTLSWADPSDSDLYYKDVFYKLTSGSTWIKSNTSNITAITYQVSGLTSGSSYDFKVVTYDKSLNASGGVIVSEIPL